MYLVVVKVQDLIYLKLFDITAYIVYLFKSIISEKYQSNWEPSPKFGVKINNIWNPHLNNIIYVKWRGRFVYPEPLRNLFGKENLPPISSSKQRMTCKRAASSKKRRTNVTLSGLEQFLDDFRIPRIITVIIYPETQMPLVLIGISALFWRVDIQNRGHLGSRYGIVLFVS